MPSLGQRACCEFVGAAFLLAAVIGSGIMAQRLAGGNIALALLGNTLPTGAILVVLILVFGPVSGAHFNPVVSMVFTLRKELPWRTAIAYIGSQIAGALVGVWYFASETVPPELTGTTPYVTTLLVLAFASQRLRMPAADGQIYRKGEAG